MILEATLSNSVIPRVQMLRPIGAFSPSLKTNLFSRYLAAFNCLTIVLKTFPPAAVNLGDLTDPLFFFPNMDLKVPIPKVVDLLM